jgi:hypothetical protein
MPVLFVNLFFDLETLVVPMAGRAARADVGHGAPGSAGTVAFGRPRGLKGDDRDGAGRAAVVGRRAQGLERPARGGAGAARARRYTSVPGWRGSLSGWRWSGHGPTSGV